MYVFYRVAFSMEPELEVALDNQVLNVHDVVSARKRLHEIVDELCDAAQGLEEEQRAGGPV
jgi:hypothetical protein